MTLGDFITAVVVLIAMFTVPRMLWRAYRPHVESSWLIIWWDNHKIAARQRRAELLSSRAQEQAHYRTTSVPQTAQTPATNVIATPQNEHNNDIVFDLTIVQLAELMDADPADITILVEAAARACIAKKKNGTAVLGETDAIKYLLQVTPGSTNPQYAAARVALKRHIELLERPQFLNYETGEREPASYPVSRRYEVDEVAA